MEFLLNALVLVLGMLELIVNVVSVKSLQSVQVHAGIYRVAPTLLRRELMGFSHLQSYVSGCSVLPNIL